MEEHVAPLVGAWIEIQHQEKMPEVKGVAPLVGAWIEISWMFLIASTEQCRSPRGSVD